MIFSTFFSFFVGSHFHRLLKFDVGKGGQLRRLVSTLGSENPGLSSRVLESQQVSTLSCNLFNHNSNDNSLKPLGIRVNKCLPLLSRRAADIAVVQGRVRINDKIALTGDRVHSGDEVQLDGVKQQWRDVSSSSSSFDSSLGNRDGIDLGNASCDVGADTTDSMASHVYLKYWKPRGVVCTSDPSDPDNILLRGGFAKTLQLRERLYCVGRLDKESTGIILLTTDGRVGNAMLRPNNNNNDDNDDDDDNNNDNNSNSDLHRKVHHTASPTCVACYIHAFLLSSLLVSPLLFCLFSLLRCLYGLDCRSI